MAPANNHEDPPSYNEEQYAKFTSSESKGSEMQFIYQSCGGDEKLYDHGSPLNTTTTSSSSSPKPKALQLELQLCLANGVSRPGSLRSGKILKTFRDAIIFDPNTTYDQLKSFVVARARHRGVLKPLELGEIQACALLVRPDGKVGSSTYFDATSWEAGRELVMGSGDAALLFVCAIVDEGYEARELKKMERKRKREGRKCVVM